MNTASTCCLLSTPNPNQNLKQKKPDTAISLLQLCKNSKELSQVHTHLIKTSLIKEKHAFGRLLLSLTSLENQTSLRYARKLFEKIDIPRNSFMYNTMIKGCLTCGGGNGAREAFVFYSRMLEEDVFADEFTFTFVFSACSKMGSVFEGKQAHAQMLKSGGVKFGTCSWNALMDFYVKIGEVGDVIHGIFYGIENPDVVSWNCLLDGYVKSGYLDAAWRVFDEMPERDVVSWTMMLVGYANAGLLSEASRLFNEMPKRNIVSWSALINGYVKMGCYSDALDLFKEMQVAKVEMDEITITSLLSACASLGALDHGRWLHVYIDKEGINVDAHLSTALIDMYSKCGQIDMARKVFQETLDKKVFVWNSMLGGLAMHSSGEEAIELFTRMIECGIEPNEITYISVLAACNHSGLVNFGLQIFHRLSGDRRLQPTIEHYGCLVDLLGRAGLLYEGFCVIKTMPIKADGSVWRTLLSACKVHGNVELGEQVGKILIKMEPLNDMNYVLLSNVYATANKWESVGMLRREMKLKGLSKTPGCSSIELNGLVYEFIARDHSHPKTQEIYELLDIIANGMVEDEHGLFLGQ